MANFFIRDMDQIVNFILQDSDQEVEMGSDDDENSDSDWEYEEEEDHKNDKTEDSAVISSTPHAKSPLSDGNRINDDVPASQNVDISIPPSVDPLIPTARYTASDSESDVYPQQQGEPSQNSSVVERSSDFNANNTDKSGANNSDASSDVSSRGDGGSGVQGRVAVRRRSVRTRGATRGITQGVGRPARGRGVGLGRSLSHGRSRGRRRGCGRGGQPIVGHQAAQALPDEYTWEKINVGDQQTLKNILFTEVEGLNCRLRDDATVLDYVELYL